VTTILLAIAFGFGCGVLLSLWVTFKFIKYGLSGIAAIFAGIWVTIGGSAGTFGRILHGFAFSAVIAWHSVFDLKKDNWLDIQFVDNAALWFARTTLWPNIKANIEWYPLGIGAFFVWGARNIGLDVSGMDPGKYPAAAGATPPAVPPATLT
jgi:hypothetical protein